MIYSYLTTSITESYKNDLSELTNIANDIIPKASNKTIIFCEIEKTSYEIFYYSFYSNGKIKHSSEIIDNDEIDSTVVDKVFNDIAKYIRKSEEFDPTKRNVITITINGKNSTIDVKQYDKSVGLYKIKKDWKNANI